jgi:hypothetical protein
MLRIALLVAGNISFLELLPIDLFLKYVTIFLCRRHYGANSVITSILLFLAVIAPKIRALPPLPYL